MYGSYMLIARTSIKLNFPQTGNHNTCTEGFSSPHSGGAYFAMSDGAVRFISENIQFNNAGLSLTNASNFPSTSFGIYQRLGSRNDGLNLGEF